MGSNGVVNETNPGAPHVFPHYRPSPEPFRHLFGLSDAGLALHGAKRYVADKRPGSPDRFELRDAEPGEKLILVN